MKSVLFHTQWAPFRSSRWKMHIERRIFISFLSIYLSALENVIVASSSLRLWHIEIWSTESQYPTWFDQWIGKVLVQSNNNHKNATRHRHTI